MYPYNNSPYPGNNPGYPPQQGNSSPYPPGSAPTYPPSPLGYPSQTNYPGSSPYPGTSPYPGSSPAYPPVGNSPYPASSSAPGYPPTGNSPYPGANSAYPGVSPAPYPGQIGFGTSGPGYPPAHTSPYPSSSIAGTPSYPIQSATVAPLSAGVPAPHSTSGYPQSYPHLPPAGLSAATAAPNFGPAMATAQPYQEVPTIRDGPFDPLSDAQALRKAMKGFGTDEKGLINVLCKRTAAQRVQITNSFKSGFGKDLIADIKSETSGNFETLLVALATPKYDYIAARLRDAVDRVGTKESVIIDILCTSSNQEIRWIQASYHRLYHKVLEQDLASDTSGAFKRLLVSLCTAQRIEDTRVDELIVTQDVNNLVGAGIKKWGTDESVFNMILANRSYPHLRAVFHQYEVVSGQDIVKSIKAEFSGDIEDALLAIVKCVKNRAAYFAERLRDSMQGMGTKDDQLVFIMVTRCDVDLESIKVEYLRMYKTSLANDISKDTSGDYKKGLLALLGM